MSLVFISLYLKAFIQNLIQKGTAVSEKVRFEFLYVYNLGTSQVMTLTFNTHIQFMMDWSPRCYIPSFVKIGRPVLEKKISDWFFTIFGCGGHLSYVTSIMSSDFHFLVTECLHTKQGSDRHSSF